jgi:hypothetical protein
MLLNNSHIMYDRVAAETLEGALLPHLHIRREGSAGKNRALSEAKQ